MAVTRRLANALDQFVAESFPLAWVEAFKGSEEPPGFTLDLRIDAGSLALSQPELTSHPLRELALLSGAEAGCDALPDHQPLDLVLGLPGETEAPGVNLSQLRNAPLVEHAAKTGARAEAGQVQPSHFVSGADSTSCVDVEKHVCERPDDRKRPGELAVPDERFQFARQCFRRVGGTGFEHGADHRRRGRY